MSEYTTETGLVVAERARWRSTVGPGAGGFGGTHAMFPAPSNLPSTTGMSVPPMQPWDGWPVEWNTPNWGDTVGLDTILGRVSVVYGCIDLNSSILSTMPPYRLAGTEVIDPVPWMGNPQPEVYTDWSEAVKQVFFAYWGQGEAFLWATSRYADGTVRQWVMLNPAWVDVDMDGQIRSYEMGGVDITDDVLHIRYTSWPGLAHGVGPLEALVANLFGVNALEQYQSLLATRGGVPWGVLSFPGNLTQTQADEARQRFVNARLSAQGAPAVISGGVTLTPFNLSPRDMALLELRQFDEGRIATLLGVPPYLMGLPSGESMIYKNVESVYDFHWRAYLRPKAAAFCKAISEWALPRGQSIELNRDEYVRPGFGERATAYATLFNLVDETGRRAITLDEIRIAERLEASDPTLDPLDPAANVAVLKAAGAPQEVIWETLGVPATEIDRWRQLHNTRRQGDAQAAAVALGATDPYSQQFGRGDSEP